MHHFYKTSTIVALLGCALATPALAAKPAAAGLFSYNYAQLSYVDLDSGFDGFKVDGSFDLTPSLALTASYMSTDRKKSIDYDLFTLGLAHHQRLVDLPKADLVLHGEFQRASLDYAYNNHDTETGIGFGAMLRYQVQKNFETFGDLSYTSLYDNDVALTLGLNLALNQQISLVGAIEMSDDDKLLLGVRVLLK